MAQGIKTATDEQIVKALEATGGLVHMAAKKVGMAGWSMWRRIHKNPELEAKLQEIREAQLDFAESQLMKAVAKGESWAICFYLKCVGKSRGYVEKSQLAHEIKSSKPAELNVRFHFVKTHGDKEDEVPVQGKSVGVHAPTTPVETL